MAESSELRNKFQAGLTDLMDKTVTEFVRAVSKETGKTEADLYKLWTSEVKKRTTRKPAAASSKGTTSTRPNCKHVIERGATKGNQCSTKAQEGSDYCGKHREKYEKGTAKPVVSKKNDSESDDDDTKTSEATTSRGTFVLQKYGDYFLHKASNFVVDSEHKLVGKLSGDKLEKNLTSADLQTAKETVGFEPAPKSSSTAVTTSKPAKGKKGKGSDSDTDSDESD